MQEVIIKFSCNKILEMIKNASAGWQNKKNLVGKELNDKYAS